MYINMHIYVYIQAMLSSDEIDLNPTDTEEEDGYTPLQLCINYKQRDWDKCQVLTSYIQNIIYKCISTYIILHINA